MRAYVYTDKALGRYAGRFVWLSVNTEDSANAAFLAKYPIPALPTLLVLDPRRDNVALRYVGGATIGQLTKLLDDASANVRKGAQNEADRHLVAADKLAAAGKHAEAANEFEAALAAAPAKWSRLGRTAESFLFSLSSADENERCAKQARKLLPRVDTNTSVANVAATGLGCALALDEKIADRATYVHELEKATANVLARPKVDISADDRSGLYISLIGAREDAKDEAGAKALRAEWSAFLDREANAAKTPEQRTVYDSHRLSAYLSLGTPEKAVEMLLQSQKDFPEDYNPPARLTAAYRALKKYDEALAANTRALQLAYGPRKIGMYTTRADIQAEIGDAAAARKTVEDAIEFVKTLPDDSRRAQRIASLQKKLEKLKTAN
jgi:tetratricopeptide (TPR) repeat protein